MHMCLAQLGHLVFLSLSLQPAQHQHLMVHSTWTPYQTTLGLRSDQTILSSALTSYVAYGYTFTLCVPVS